MGELIKIPNIGKVTESNLNKMGYYTADDIMGKSAEELYASECELRGCTVDRCQLYLYRAVLSYINGEPEPENGWHWSNFTDERVRLRGKADQFF